MRKVLLAKPQPYGNTSKRAHLNRKLTMSLLCNSVSALVGRKGKFTLSSGKEKS